MISEKEIAAVICRILARRPKRQATIAELVDEIPRRTTLSRADLARSSTRPRERKWEQRVRNLVSHRNDFDGRLRFVEGSIALSGSKR